MKLSWLTARVSVREMYWNYFLSLFIPIAPA
jgi:hypothetical protein